jgi:hypothetical protein
VKRNQSRSERPAKIIDIQAGERDESANGADYQHWQHSSYRGCLYGFRVDTTIGFSGVLVGFSTMTQPSFGKKEAPARTRAEAKRDSFTGTYRSNRALLDLVSRPFYSRLGELMRTKNSSHPFCPFCFQSCSRQRLRAGEALGKRSRLTASLTTCQRQPKSRLRKH